MKIDPGRVLAAMAANTGTTPEMLCGPRRYMPLARSRQFAYLVMADLCPHLSLPQIGRVFGDRDHTTIMHGMKLARRLANEDPELAKWFDRIEREIRISANPPATEYAAFVGAAA